MSESQPGIIDRFDHATVLVKDVTTAAATYEALLGIRPTWRGSHPELGSRAVLFGLSNGIIELVGPGEDSERAAGLVAQLESQGEGLYAIAFGTQDAALCSAVLRERGVRATAPEDGEAQPELAGRPTRSYRVVGLSPRATRGISVLAVERGDVNDLQATHVPRSGSVDALDHVVIRTGDPEAALALYGDGLGIRLALDRDLRGTRMLFFRVGGVTIEVVEGGTSSEQDSFGGLALRVGDIDKAHRRLAEAGFDLGEIRDGNKARTQVFSVRDGTCGVPTLIIRDPARDR